MTKVGPAKGAILHDAGPNDPALACRVIETAVDEPASVQSPFLQRGAGKIEPDQRSAGDFDDALDFLNQQTSDGGLPFYLPWWSTESSQVDPAVDRSQAKSVKALALF